MENRVAIVTGSSAGIGLAIAQAFAEAGVNVVINGRNLEKLEVAFGLLEEYGERVLPLRGDASNDVDINRIVSITKSHFGRVDYLVNNAATLGVGQTVAEMPVEVWDNVMNVNLRGVFLFCKTVIPHLMAQKSGRIINIGGLSSKNPLPFAAADAASKAGLLALTRVLAAELGVYNVTANAVLPGSAPETELGKQFNQKLAEAFHTTEENIVAGTKSRTLLKRFETMDEIAQTVMFLCSDSGAAITGQNINVNCGLATY
jgi:NAD(P)-dependent dehydrogenase (short-subunit alcohol dehydrogenase family)